MADFTKELLFGMRPVRRTNPQPGESEWYYLDPRGADTFDSMNYIDVESETSPNPYAGAIQNYLYKNDPYNYKQLYGNTPPPTEPVQTQNNNVQQLTMPAGSEQQITMPKPQQPSTWNKFKNWAENTGDAMQAASVGYATGATLGNFDEAMGTATAALTLNPDNYTMGRDAVRQLQSDLSQRHPYIYGGAEFVGAMNTLMHLAKDTTFANKALNALTDTGLASIGYAQNSDDFAMNLAINAIANNIGLQAEKLPIWRAAGNTFGRFVAKNGPKIAKQGINYFADKTKKMFYTDDGEDR